MVIIIKTFNTTSRAVFFLAAIVAVFGCNRGGQFAPVSGIVTFEGEPLVDAYIVFEPLQGTPDQVSQSKTDADGKYVLSSSSGRAGAVVGRHNVHITTVPPDAMDDERSPLPKDRVPMKYQRQPLTFDVPQDGSDSADFALSK